MQRASCDKVSAGESMNYGLVFQLHSMQRRLTAMRILSNILTVTGLAVAALAQAPPPSDADGPPDEPGRQVARLSILNGDAQIKRADTGEWVAAAVNTPLMAGDSLAVSNNGRA